MNRSEPVSGARTVRAEVNYVSASTERPRFYANDHSRDILPLDPRQVDICDARTLPAQPTLAHEGIEIVPFPASIANWRDTEELTQSYLPQVRAFMLALTGADDVVVMGRAVLRFVERSAEAGKHDNSSVAGFIHIDVSDSASRSFAQQMAPPGRAVRRSSQHNIWRTFSGAPQDVPLAVCDARTVAAHVLVPADSVFDTPGQPEWSFESLLVRYDPSHRWLYYSNMQPEEALVFKRHDTDSAQPCYVPHTAFRDPSAPEGAIPRASVEARSVAYWFE